MCKYVYNIYVNMYTWMHVHVYMCTYCTQFEFVALAPCMKKCRSQLGRGYSLLTPLFGPGVSAAAGTLEGFRLVRGAMGCDSRRVMVRMNREMRILGWNIQAFASKNIVWLWYTCMSVHIILSWIHLDFGLLLATCAATSPVQYSMDRDRLLSSFILL